MVGIEVGRMIMTTENRSHLEIVFGVTNERHRANSLRRATVNSERARAAAQGAATVVAVAKCLSRDRVPQSCPFPAPGRTAYAAAIAARNGAGPMLEPK